MKPVVLVLLPALSVLSVPRPMAAGPFTPQSLGYRRAGTGDIEISLPGTGHVAVYLAAPEPGAKLHYEFGAGADFTPGKDNAYYQPFVLGKPGKLRAVAVQTDGKTVPADIYTRDLSAEGVMADFAWARKLYNPRRPKTGMVSMRRHTEQVKVIRPGTIEVLNWQGDREGGGRGWSGNNFFAAPGANFYFALDEYELKSGGGSNDRQDANIHICWFDCDAGKLPGSHGATIDLGRPLPANALVFQLAFRHPGWNGRFHAKHGYTAGNNPQSTGIWQVPKGKSLNEAQKTSEHRLAILRWITEYTPKDKNLAFKLQVQRGGHWQLLVDVGRDGKADRVVSDSDADAKKCSFDTLDERGSLVVVFSPAGGNRPGQVGTTRVVATYRPSRSEPIPSTNGNAF